jgi:hypothetical protein
MEKETIRLRVMGFVREDEFQLICLDTDIVVSAKSIDEAKKKMGDAIVSYFKTFSGEEIEQGLFIRKAPMRYFILWRIGSAMGFAISIVYFFSSIAKYDPDSQSLKLA